MQVVNLALWESFERELNAWEEEKERRQVEFDCTEADPHHDRRVARITEDVRRHFIILFSHQCFKFAVLLKNR